MSPAEAGPTKGTSSMHLTIQTPDRTADRSTARASRRHLAWGVRWHLATSDLRDRLGDAWERRAEEDGIDEAVTKMIWLAVGIGVAITATAFFLGVFETAKSNVPDPVPAG